MKVPTIDVAAWRSAGDEERKPIARDVDEALCTSGFLVAINHGIPAELIDRVRREAAAFFALDPADKAAYAVRVGGRGWIPPGAESNAYASGEESPPDLKETLKLGYHPDDSAMANRWPSEVPHLRPAAEAYLAAVWAVALDCFELLTAALGLAPLTLGRHASAEESSLNLNWYPSLDAVGPPEEGQFRIGAHSDFGVLTLLDRQAGYGGLQLRTPDGDWVDAPVVEHSLTINVGDLLARWTGDRWRSTVHRVLPPSEQDAAEELLSLVCFCGIEPDTVVETLDVAGPHTYPPVRAGDYLREKLAAIDTAG
ncbi:MAG: 2-oxoglutarate and iron-dependent oxygenase domain-containing protein [Actinomycetota bacterium]